MTMSDVRAEYHLQVGETYDCTDKRNCIMLTGLYQCTRGQCMEVRQISLFLFLINPPVSRVHRMVTLWSVPVCPRPRITNAD